MYLVIAIVILVVVAAVAVRETSWANPQRHASVPVLLAVILGLAVYLHRIDADARDPGAPILLAVAADVSLSMGTMPDPSGNRAIGTRLERIQRVLLPLFAELAAVGRPVMVSVTAFTAKSETILAWDDDLSLAQEIAEFVLSVGLLTEAGSDIGVALDGAKTLFDNLPEDYRGADYPRFLIVASDGEQTASGQAGDAAIAQLRDQGVRLVALHVGLEDPQEGLPVFDDNEDFIGFEEVGGQIFSIPDPAIMRATVGEDTATGLFVSADSGDAVATIADFIGLQSSGAASASWRSGAVLLLWALLVFTLLRRL